MYSDYMSVTLLTKFLMLKVKEKKETENRFFKTKQLYQVFKILWYQIKNNEFPSMINSRVCPSGLMTMMRNPLD